jgi:ATP-dependent DNA ligase
MKLPKMYKKNSKGTLEEWEISTKANYITIIFGDELGKKQVKHEEIKEGKNLGRKLETTAVEQAEKEAKSRFNAQLKKGYCKTKADALAGKTDEIIKGGILPMLAEKYKDQKDKIVFPCAVQPKLDGQRCIAIREGGTVTLWTRTRKPITSCPHIIEAVLGTLNGVDGDIVLDGELFCNSMLIKPFETINGVLIDEEDIPKLNGYNIYLTNGYPCVVNKQRESKYVHRILMDEPCGDVDHKNGNKLDCRKSNLRLCTTSENIANTQKRVTNTSGYKGVMFFKRDKNWHAQITKDYEKIHIGYFDSAKDAAKAYDKKAKELFGEFAVLNFPDPVVTFESLMSAVRKKEPSPESLMVQFHVYDCHVEDDISMPFKDRLDFLNELPEFDDCIEFVKTYLVHSHEDIASYHDQFVRGGYEGLMFRDVDSLYENKRSKGLLKMKDFHDHEFNIISVVEGGDGAVVFMCKNDLGVTFEAPMNGEKKNNQKYLKDKSLWEGKKLNVRYQGLTGAKKVPRFPQGKYIREEE